MNPRNNFTPILLACLLSLIVLQSRGQSVVDTFERWVNRVEGDSLRIGRIAQVAKYFENIDTAVAFKYLNLAKRINARDSSPFITMTTLEMEGVLYTKSNPARAYELYEKAVKIGNEADTSQALNLFQASLKNNLGVVSYLNGDYEGAVSSFTDAANVYDYYGDPTKNLAVTLNNISTTYAELGYFTKSLEYNRRSVANAEKNGLIKSSPTSYIGFAATLINLSKYDSAFIYLNKARTIATATGNKYDLYLVDNNLGWYYEKLEKYDSSIFYYNQALPYAQSINSPYDVAVCRVHLAVGFVNTGKYDAGQNEIDSVDAIITKYNFRELRKDWYELKSEFFEERGNTKDALAFRKKLEELKDSIQTETRLKRIDFLEARYQSAKRQIDIDNLQKQHKIQELELRQRRVFNYSLLAGLITLAVVIALLFRNSRNKQLLSKQTELLHARRIKELEQEKQLVSMNSLLKGQEEERGRMAKDLHDGLGGMLSGVKLSLGAMKGDLILSEESARLFSKALGQLDNSIGEMRRVAHNMMPEALVRLGLQQAVQDYCEGLSESQPLKINAQFHGLENRLDPSTEIVVYRIVQELLNNVVKHASATSAFVQVMRHDNNLNITVEDNGRGFDASEVDNNSGAGLSNIRSRVDYLKGNLDIQTTPGKGTSVHIDCIID
ncbi:MAG: sensor histidine kinase [Chitinophagaceae bacterium]|nr:sensor histidine kinase [Chitinophagaceae bacterium]